MRRGAIVVALASATACATRPPPPPIVIGSTPPPSPAPVAVEPPVDDLALVPIHAELVLGLDIRRMQASALWAQLVEPELAKNKLDTFQAACGFNPFQAITTATMAMEGLGGAPANITGVVIVHGLDKAKTLACVDRMKDQPTGVGARLSRDGDVIVSEDKSGLEVAMRFVRADTLLVAIGGGKGALEASAAGRVTSLRSSAAFVAMFETIDTTRAVWLVMRGDSKALAAVAEAGIQLKAVFGTIDVTDRVAIRGRARLDSAATAARLATAFRGQAASLQGLVDPLDITSDGVDLAVEAAISLDKLQLLAAMVNTSSTSTGP